MCALLISRPSYEHKKSGEAWGDIARSKPQTFKDEAQASSVKDPVRTTQ
jgi:hypothetical protein